MAAPKSETELITAAAERFRNQDPDVYEHFLRALRAYTDRITVAVTDASPDTILCLQGRAQQARKFYQLMSEFPTKPSP